MSHRIKSAQAGNELNLEVTFFDGTVKVYDLKKMFSVYPPMKELTDNPTLFHSFQIDAGGYALSWNDDLDLDAETIWEEGTFIRKESTSFALELASRLTEAREKAGITQTQLAERTGIYQADISRIERGMGNPSVNTLQRLADGIGVRLIINFM